jgi:hypothetical protein
MPPAERLVEKGVLRRSRRRLFWVISKTTYPAAGLRPETAMKERMRSVVLDNADDDSRTILLIGLASACGSSMKCFRGWRGRRRESGPGRSSSGTMSAVLAKAIGEMEAAAAAAAAVVVTAVS